MCRGRKDRGNGTEKGRSQTRALRRGIADVMCRIGSRCRKAVHGARVRKNASGKKSATVGYQKEDLRQDVDCAGSVYYEEGFCNSASGASGAPDAN